MSDALTLLRTQTINKTNTADTTNIEDDLFVIGEWCCPKDSETYLKNGRSAYYSIESVWFLLQNEGLTHAEYVIKCQRLDITAIRMVDRKHVLAYIRGEVETNKIVDPTKNPGTLSKYQPNKRKLST